MIFQGYVRPDGTVGSRNLVAVIPSVVCANDVAQAIVAQVQGTVGLYHHQGCCQLPPDLDRVTETLIGLGCGPNVGAALVVSLGCEGTDHERLVQEIARTGKPVEIIRIQQLGGVSKAIAAGIEEKVLEVLGEKVWRIEGQQNAVWIAMDYVDVVVHIFQTELRGFYRLEELWADAPMTKYEYEE